MNILNVPIALLRVQYKLVRIPMQLVEDHLMSRLPTESPPRLMYERTLGSLDSAVGRALGDRASAQRGDALTERSDALSRAAELEQQATRTETEAETKFHIKRKQAYDEQMAAHEAKQREIEQARRREDERTQAAEHDAEQRTQAAKKQADQRAAQQTAAAEAQHIASQTALRKAERKAAVPAEAQLTHAADKQAEATDKRAHADRLEKLSEAEKAKRRASTTTNPTS